MKLRWLAIGSIVGVIGLAATLAVGDEERESRGWLAAMGAPAGVQPVDNPLYAAECGSCHYAYPAGLLPKRSWKRVMSGLADHFGENAELSTENQKLITEYLIANSAETDRGWIARGLLRSVPEAATPLRITETGYFQHQHDELPPRLWRDNPKVGSLANCSACHTKADNGSFDEHQVTIPGVGRWED